jgi:carbamoyl-phosphate synthase small subunit
MGGTLAWLVLSDGSAFRGRLETEVHSDDRGVVAEGEVVFNTALSGYQEVISDPSYAGQFVVFTNPHIGNYGVNDDDWESSMVAASGVVVKSYCDSPSNWRATSTLRAVLNSRELPLLSGVDTRRLTRLVRAKGSLAGVIGVGDPDSLVAAARVARTTDGRDLVEQVTRKAPTTVSSGKSLHVVAFDFGIKASMERALADRFSLTVVPATTDAEAVLALEPDGVFLSNGPGDPAPLSYAAQAIRSLGGKVPIFGICLGHQLLALAYGASVEKLRFGHHGANHPVSKAGSRTVEITSQNHNYAVARESLVEMSTAVEVSHVNLNDGVIEGLRYPELGAFSVQYHPEAGPGPHDSYYLFDEFQRLIDAGVPSA